MALTCNATSSQRYVCCASTSRAKAQISISLYMLANIIEEKICSKPFGVDRQDVLSNTPPCAGACVSSCSLSISPSPPCTWPLSRLHLKTVVDKMGPVGSTTRGSARGVTKIWYDSLPVPTTRGDSPGSQEVMSYVWDLMRSSPMIRMSFVASMASVPAIPVLGGMIVPPCLIVGIMSSVNGTRPNTQRCAIICSRE